MSVPLFWQTNKRELADGLLEVAEGFGTGLYNSVTTRIKPYIETLRALALVDLTYPLARAFPLLEWPCNSKRELRWCCAQ